MWLMWPREILSVVYIDSGYKSVFVMIMKGCSNTSRRAYRHVIILSLFAVAALLFLPAQSQDDALGQRLIVNVYLDNAGKALVTGYAENVRGLSFLNNSQFRFENESHQLYALTDNLTTKSGDLWTLNLDARGSFDDYRVTFYLPSETSLGEINASQGLGYLLSASNESLVADVQGWEISDPRISIQYQQPLAANGSNLPPLPPGYPGGGAALIMLLIAAALLVAGFGFAVFLQRKKRGSTAGPIENGVRGAIEEEWAKEKIAATTAPQSELPDTAVPLDLHSAEDDGVFRSEGSEESHAPLANEPGREEPSPSQASGSEDVLASACPSTESAGAQEISAAGVLPTSPVEPSAKNAIVVSSEMEAVMQTLTAREQAVMSTLIAHGGRMTQAEIRYETGTPKSSLTGILISLERRKLVSKKEWGRTNIIELSDWFLSKKERS